jgi:FtsH-binding integral membrane protein
MQLLIATAIVAWFSLDKGTKDYFNTTGGYWLYVAMAAGLIVYFVLVCVESSRRSYPLNFILLLVLTLAYGLIAGIFSARFQTVTVLSAFAATAVATLVVILLAKFSPFDITTCGCALCVLAMVHLFGSLLLIIILVPNHAGVASLLIAGTGAFLVSLYLLFDLQLIMGGRTLELSPEEYILAAAMLYIDIINLFQYMLILFGGRE